MQRSLNTLNISIRVGFKGDHCDVNVYLKWEHTFVMSARIYAYIARMLYLYPEKWKGEVATTWVGIWRKVPSSSNSNSPYIPLSYTTYLILKSCPNLERPKVSVGVLTRRAPSRLLQGNLRELSCTTSYSMLNSPSPYLPELHKMQLVRLRNISATYLVRIKPML